MPTILPNHRGKRSSEELIALNFVRRSVCCCSAVARDSLSLPSPSLGVSSLDLGRSRKVSGPFYYQALFSGGTIGPQLLDRDFGETIRE